MAKQHSRQKQQGKSAVEERRGSDDPLGKLIVQYQVTLAAVLVVSGTVALLGLGLIGYGRNAQPRSVLFLSIGTAALLLAVVRLAMNAFNIGRRLELRKRGVRFCELGSQTEFFWDDITDIEVNRLDETNLGIASVRKKSPDAVSPSGLLTKTEWEITIHAQDGRRIHLSRMFLRMVPDPKKLVSQLRMQSGQ